MQILALDLGNFNTMCCFFDTKTRKHSFLNAATDRNYLTTVFKKHKIDLVVMEACRAWFVNHGISIDKGGKAWHTGRKLINPFRKPIHECGPTDLWKGELDLELTQLDALTMQMDSVVKKLELIGKRDPRIVRVQTIPGFGPRTAEIFGACIDDAKRFETGRQECAWASLKYNAWSKGVYDRIYG